MKMRRSKLKRRNIDYEEMELEKRVRVVVEVDEEDVVAMMVLE